MNKQALKKSLRKAYGFSWKDAGEIIEAIFSSVREALRQGERVRLQNFGTFAVVPFATRRYRHIKTRTIFIKGITHRVKFKPSRNILEP